MKTHILDTFFLMVMVVCAADLIFLYIVGIWHDPIRSIEVAELCLMVGIIVTGLILIVLRLRKIRKVKR